MWTSEDLAEKRGLIAARAYQHWHPYAFALDRSFLEDLEQEAWEAALALSPDDPLLAMKIDNALRAYLRYWRLGLRSLGSTTAPRQIYQQVPMEAGKVTHALRSRAPMSPESTSILRELLTLIWLSSTEPMQQVWIAQLLQNSLSLKRRDYRILKLSESQVSRARKKLQRVAIDVFQGKKGV